MKKKAEEFAKTTGSIGVFSVIQWAYKYVAEQAMKELENLRNNLGLNEPLFSTEKE